MTSSFHFFKAAIKEPLQISTLFQTSSSVVKALISPLQVDPHCSVLELGVGAGAVTEKIFKNMNNKDKYIGIEINEDLYKFVSNRYKGFKFTIEILIQLISFYFCFVQSSRLS